MKNFFGTLIARLGGRREPEPTDPVALHDFLYQRATQLVQPFLLLDGAPAKNSRGAQGQADLQRAIGLFERVLTINPENWAAAWLAGKAAQSRGAREQSYDFFRRAFELQPQNPDVARELMIACLDTRRAPEGVKIAEHAVRLSPSDPGLQANLALARLCAGDVSGATAAIEHAVDAAPNDQVSLTLRGLIAEVASGRRKPPETPADLAEA